MKVLALTPFHIYPPTFGGAERCFNLLSGLGEVTVFSLNWEGIEKRERIGKLNYRLIPADPKAVERSQKLIKSGIKTYDPMPMLTKNDLKTFRQAIEDSDPDLIILEHPWLLDLIEDRPYIYDSHNCETYNTEQQHGGNSLDFDLVRDLEERAVNGAEHFTYTSPNDLRMMRRYFEIETPHTLIPNGCELPDTIATGEQKNLIFIGSLYGPNVRAAKELIAQARLLPGYNIQILGDCANLVQSEEPNVQLIGRVTEKQMDWYLKNAYAFINLVSQGSGTHLKIGRALAYGLPVLTTPIGSRGYEEAGGVIQTSAGNLVDTLKAVSIDWNRISTKARNTAATMTWQKIAADFKEVIYGLQ